MTDIEKRNLKNQIEIMWTLHYILAKIAPDLVGKRGELDTMRDDLIAAVKDTARIVDAKP